MKENLQALKEKLQQKNLSDEERTLIKQYYLNLKTDYRMFEEAIDNVKYGFISRINTSELNAGIYIIKIIEKEQTTTHKITIN